MKEDPETNHLDFSGFSKSGIPLIYANGKYKRRFI